jgi:hypothetical protein
MRAFIAGVAAVASVLAGGLLVALAAGAVALAVPAFTASAAFASTCQAYRGTAHDAASSPAGPYIGVDNITIGSTT